MIEDYTMDSSTYKFYHEDPHDSRQHLEHYMSDKSDNTFAEDFLKFPIENLRKIFTDGHIKGDVLVDISKGSLIPHLFAACEFFKHIIVLKVTDRCLMELKRWVAEHTGAFDWSHVTKLHADIEEDSDQSQEIEANVRSALQHVVKCDLEKEDMMEPIVIPPADCIISAGLLDVISKDQDDYARYFGKFSKLLKPGGHFILLGVLNATYFINGKEKYHVLKYDENFVRNALVREGFIIDRCVVKNAEFVCDLIDYKAVMFIAAHKEK